MVKSHAEDLVVVGGAGVLGALVLSIIDGIVYTLFMMYGGWVLLYWGKAQAFLRIIPVEPSQEQLDAALVMLKVQFDALFGVAMIVAPTVIVIGILLMGIGLRLSRPRANAA